MWDEDAALVRQIVREEIALMVKSSSKAEIDAAIQSLRDEINSEIANIKLSIPSPSGKGGK